jgi:histidyl-tRNA synthetase
MANNIQAIRGMHDVLPDQTPRWQFVEQQVRDVLELAITTFLRTLMPKHLSIIPKSMYLVVQ